MKSSLLISAAVLAALGLAACEKTVVQPTAVPVPVPSSPSTVVVPTPVPGPPGAPGPQGSSGPEGTPGKDGRPGSGNTIVVVPPAEPEKR